MTESPLSQVQAAFARALENDGTYVTLIGDLIIDQWIRGYVSKMSQEDETVPVLEQEEGETTLGGAALVYKHLVTMGLPLVKFISVRGYDHEYCYQDPEDPLKGPHVHLVEDGKRPATIKSRIIVKPRRQIARVDRESRDPISGRVQNQVMQYVRDAIGPQCRLVMISDYGKGVITDEVMNLIRLRCDVHGIPFIVDPTKCDPEAYTGAALITPNDDEYDYMRTFGPNLSPICLTRGQFGMILLNKGLRLQCDATMDKCVDAIGAGDMFFAAVGVFMAGGAPLELAVQMANAIAGWFVSRTGTASPSPPFVDRLIVQHAQWFKKGT